MIKSDKIKEKLQEVWKQDGKSVPYQLLNDLVDYSIMHEVMEKNAFEKNIKKMIEKNQPVTEEEDEVS